MILVDTSAWIEYDRASGSPVDRRLSELISADHPLAVTEPVMMEVLAAAHNERGQADLRRLLLRFHLLAVDPVSDFEAAAGIFRRCRRSGTTPRGMVDCLVTAVAWRRGATLLAHDPELARLAGVVGVELDRASLGAAVPSAGGPT